MGSIETLSEKLTVLMVAHRVTTLKLLYNFRAQNGQISNIGSYKNISQNNIDDWVLDRKVCFKCQF